MHICAVSKSGAVSQPSLTATVSTKVVSEKFDISAFGAIADSKTLNVEKGGVAANSVFMAGLPESLLQHIVLENV